MRFTSLSSGSSGNVSYIGTENTHVLVDVGVTMKAINAGLSKLELSLKDIQGIFLTHEHIDHIKAVGTISRKYGIPIYGTLETLQGLISPGGKKKLGELDHGLLHPILPDQESEIGELTVLPFSIDHDAVNPVAYRVTDGKKTVAVATDMGHFDAYIEEHLKDLDAMLVESNHDIAMLSQGPYPMELKRRILSDHGHLSNENAGKLIDRILHDRVQHIFLGHLSQENNLPGLAKATVEQEIEQSESGYHAGDFPITVAKRDGISEIVEL